MFGVQQAIHVWLTLWLSFQFTMDEIASGGGIKSPGYAPLPYADVQYWTQQMNELMEQVGDEDVEFYLPQLAAVLLRRDAPTRCNQVTTAVAVRLGSILRERAATNHMVGMHLLWQLRAATQGGAGLAPAGGRSAAAAAAAAAEQRGAEGWLSVVEPAAVGGGNLPRQVAMRRQAFFCDNMRFVDRLVGLSRLLGATDVRIRLAELHRHLGELNRCLLRRIDSRGKAFETPLGAEWPLEEADVASRRPDAANFAIVLPLRAMAPGCREGRCVLRVLRIVKELSHPLQSRERVPYLVTAEVLQTSIG
ncbi:hypothetical protein JKP88DRAFT_292092 [Tribonema minus]|uniref:PIK helical domain-containing protein n=1 Tax=Tribonema minus TaxID=303371 RepID=A0A835ZF92_9STRA|nr:hypothetical protein JKP88DRAFT_292092 [Tribonema minus]